MIANNIPERKILPILILPAILNPLFYVKILGSVKLLLLMIKNFGVKPNLSKYNERRTILEMLKTIADLREVRL